VPSKACARCGRQFTWRKRWARTWDSARSCSDACQRRQDAYGEVLERTIVELLETRAPGATICPSEAARAVAPETWRELMEAARAAARRLVMRGEVQVLQRGQVVDPDTARGPIRLRLVRRAAR
jgi:hypothetical protein